MKTIKAGTVKSYPSSPIASQHNKDQWRSNVKVDYGDGTEAEAVYFTAYGDMDYLQPGDTVFIQFGKSRNGKPTKTITLTPELAATLQARKAEEEGIPDIQLQPEPQPLTVVPQPGTPHRPGANPKPPTAADFTDVAEMALIYKALRREIPEAADECICNLAQSVFKYRRDTRY